MRGKKGVSILLTGLVLMFITVLAQANDLETELASLRWKAADDFYGAEPNPTGDPIGGGEGYSSIFTDGDYVVSTAEELINALKSAKAGEVVYVAPDSTIDLTNRYEIVIPKGVTLAGNRGVNKSEGPLLFSNSFASPLFLMGGGNARITGLRIQGPNNQSGSTSAIKTILPQNIIDNNEIYNWAFAGVYVNSPDTYIHHNYLHHVQQSGLGYLVVTYKGTALVEANLMDYYRHAIAGDGSPGSGYEARYNLVYQNANSFSFDMHGGRDRGDGTDIAADYVLIHHNTFFIEDESAIVIRGIPQDRAEIYNNWFVNLDPSGAFRQQNAQGNVYLYNNVYGKDMQFLEEAIGGDCTVDDKLNLALAENGGKAISDSNYSGYNPSVVIDGELNDRPEAGRWSETSWASQDVLGEHWLEIHLAQESEISRISIWWARDREKWWMSSDYVVEYWDSQTESWVIVFDYKTDQEIFYVYSTNIDIVPVTTSKIRILQKVGGGPIARPNIMWIAEVQVFGNR